MEETIAESGLSNVECCDALTSLSSLAKYLIGQEETKCYESFMRSEGSTVGDSCLLFFFFP